MKLLISRTYPYLSILCLQISNKLDITYYIDIISDFQDIGVMFFQFIIGGMTMIKLGLDLKLKIKKN